MITKEQYVKWLRTATKREVAFVNCYLKTLNATTAFQEAGYNYKQPKVGKCKVFTRLLPYIQYKLKEADLNITKNFIVIHWLELLSSGDSLTRQNALKELTKIFGYIDDSTKVEVNNNIPQIPVVIKFNEKEGKSE